MIEDAEYGLKRIELESGDKIFLISDGIYEARNPQKADLGIERVYEHLKNERINNYSLEYTVNSTARAAYHWCLPEKPDDDISIVGLEIR
jgi:serine phosphatase RsbU (regulator of sigma subunit)